MGLLSFLKPSIAINMLRKNLEKQLNKKVEFFSLVYKANTNSMSFICDGITYNFSDDTIKGLIEKTSRSQLKKNQSLDIIIANVDQNNNCDAKLYYSETKKIGSQIIIEKNFVTHKF